MGVLFTPIPLPEDRMSYVKQVEGLGRRVTVLWFTEGDVRDAWEAGFAGAVDQAKADGGRHLPVRRTVPTDHPRHQPVYRPVAIGSRLMADTPGEPFTGEIPARLAPPREGMHPDDEFHVPTTDTTDWSETCWFTFTVPERKLSGQLYPFFRANLNTMAAGAYFWDPSGNRMDNCVYSKNFWHLPIPQQPLSDIAIGNGIHYRCVEPQQQYEVSYHDPDGGDEIHVELDVRRRPAAALPGAQPHRPARPLHRRDRHPRRHDEGRLVRLP